MDKSEKETLKKTAIMEFLTKDVDMRQIPVKGRRAVLVQVEIIFNDGGAESAKLVPSATAPKAVTPK